MLLTKKNIYIYRPIWNIGMCKIRIQLSSYPVPLHVLLIKFGSCSDASWWICVNIQTFIILAQVDAKDISACANIPSRLGFCTSLLVGQTNSYEVRSCGNITARLGQQGRDAVPSLSPFESKCLCIHGHLYFFAACPSLYITTDSEA